MMPSYSHSESLCISCVHVVDEGSEVNCISRSGGDWVLLCGSSEHYSDDKNSLDGLVTIHHSHITQNFPEVADVMGKLNIDYTAERSSPSDKWIFYFDPDSE